MYANVADNLNEPGVILSAIWESAYNVITVSYKNCINESHFFIFSYVER